MRGPASMSVTVVHEERERLRHLASIATPITSSPEAAGEVEDVFTGEMRDARQAGDGRNGWTSARRNDCTPNLSASSHGDGSSSGERRVAEEDVDADRGQPRRRIVMRKVGAARRTELMTAAKSTCGVVGTPAPAPARVRAPPARPEGALRGDAAGSGSRRRAARLDERDARAEPAAPPAHTAPRSPADDDRSYSGAGSGYANARGDLGAETIVVHDSSSLCFSVRFPPPPRLRRGAQERYAKGAVRFEV